MKTQAIVRMPLIGSEPPISSSQTNCGGPRNKSFEEQIGFRRGWRGCLGRHKLLIFHECWVSENTARLGLGRRHSTPSFLNIRNHFFPGFAGALPGPSCARKMTRCSAGWPWLATWPPSGNPVTCDAISILILIVRAREIKQKHPSPPAQKPAGFLVPNGFDPSRNRKKNNERRNEN